MTLEAILALVTGVEKLVAHFKDRGGASRDDGTPVTAEELQAAVDEARAEAQGLIADAEASLRKRHGG